MKKALLALIAIGALAAASLPATASGATPGTLAFVSNSDGDDEIYTISSNGGAATQLTFNADTDKDPSWSPDGKQIAFASDRDPGTDPDIWVMNADGSSPRQLTFNTVTDFAIDWSPDGKRLVFGISSTPNAIWTMNVDGTGLRQLTTYMGPGGPYGSNFSPDGTKLVLMNFDGTNQPLGVMSSEGGLASNITTAPPDAWAPDFTADGKRVVYYGVAPDGGPDDEILSIAATGGDLRQLTSNTGAGSGDTAARASRDGLNRIAYRNNLGGDNEIWVMNADGSGQTQLTFNTFNDRGPDWQPNVKCGKGVATIVGTSASETLTGGPGPDIISGQGGKDKIKGLGGKDVICGDKGKDNLNGGAGNDQLFGGKGKDKTVGGKGKDKCVGGGGDDSGKGCEKEKSL